MSGPIDELAAEIDRRIDRRLGRVDRHLSNVEGEIATVAKQVAHLLRLQGVQINDPEQEQGEDDAIAQVDQTWQCVKCGSRLGYYSPADDVLRIKHKDLLMWVQPGAGGKVSIVCRNCGELNTVSDDTAGVETG